MMQPLLSIATLLGGLAALWFFWDRRRVISAWLKIRTRDGINPLSLGDDDFVFLSSKSVVFLITPYLPINSDEEEKCKSLTNTPRVLIKRGKHYRLSNAGRLILRNQRGQRA